MGADPASIAIKAGMMALQMGLTMLNKTEGPRLDNLDVSLADYGTPHNYFWGKRRLPPSIFFAEPLREKKVESKTKGGKYSEYKYFGTFAVLVADHPIDAVSRIWMDKHLVYDVTGAGPISPVLGLVQGLSRAVKLTHGRNMRIYKGDQTTPDPRMEAYCEDRYGADSCPAYKDVSYIVFEELPLEKFGNRIPQITVEAINVSSTIRPYETKATGAATGPSFSPDYTRIMFNDTVGSDFTIWDVPTRTKIIDATLPIHAESLCFDSDGRIWGLGDTLNSKLRVFTSDGFHFLAQYDLGGSFAERLHILGDVKYMRPLNGGGTSIYRFTGSIELIDVGFTPQYYFEDLDSNHWCVGLDGTNIKFYNITDGAGSTVASPGGATGSTAAFCNSEGNFFVTVGNSACVIDPDTMSVLVSATGVNGSANGTRWMPVGSARYFSENGEYDANTLEVKQTYLITSWTNDNTNNHHYDPINHALLSEVAGSMTWRFLDRVDSNGVELSDVVSEVAGWCSVETADVSALTQTVEGYSVVQGSGKDMIAPLLDIHDVDAHPHDFGMKFTVRGNSPIGTIPVSEFVREGDEPRYQITIKQDTDLPRQISISFADQDKEQQTNTVLAQRPLDAMDGDRTQQIDLTTYVGTPGDMQKVADRYHRRQWNGRESVTNALTLQYLATEPADVYNLELDGVTQSHRLKKWTLSRGRINIEWERDFPSLNLLGSGAGAELDARDNDTIYIPAPTKGFVKDIPLIQDSHSSTNPLLYYGAGAYTSSDWPGATIYEGDADGDDYFPWKGVEPGSKAVWGYATDTLGDANPWLWDRGNSVNIKTFGTLTSCTEADINSDPARNMALLGDELLNFTTATLEADGTYTLSGFKRGRRGTEWAVGDHDSGDEFMLVSGLASDALGLSEVGLSLNYKAQTVGRELTGAPSIEIDFSGNSLKPYAPARVIFSTDGTDLSGEIVRRTRVGGSWSDDGVVSLSENSEEYEVDVYVGATLKRTITVTGTNEFTYTAAQMVTDGTTLATLPTFNVYQMSDAVGRGFALAA